MNKRKIRIRLIALIMVLTLAGCVKTEKHMPVELNENQISALESVDASLAESLNSKESGVGYVAERFEDLKSKAGEYLKGKYGHEFNVTGGGLKDVLTQRDYLVYSTPDEIVGTSGDYFNVYVDEAGEISDEYYSILKQDELSGYLEGIVDSNGVKS